MLNRLLSDSIIETILLADNITVDSVNCLKDEYDNKLITIIYPVNHFYSNTCPFSNYCFMEDNAGGFRVTYLMDKNGNLKFLKDELTYIGNADFDNDGKDEFIFWYSIFNHEGYVLFYDNFTKHTEYM